MPIWQPGQRLSHVEVRRFVMITCRSLPLSTDSGTCLGRVVPCGSLPVWRRAPSVLALANPAL